MGALRTVVAAALLVPALSPAGAEPAAHRCEARGGRAWREYRTAHFVVGTDLSGARGEALVRDLEQLHALVVQALVGEQVDIPGKVRIVAFSDPAEFEKVAPEGVSGYFRVDWLSRPTIVFAAEGFQAEPEVIAHELAHHVSWYLFPRQPLWFAEGLAQFVQTVAREKEQAMPHTGTHVVRGGRETGGRWAGLAPAPLVRFLHEAGSGMPEDLLTWRGGGSSGGGDRYYAWSWLLYHWVWNARPKAFTDFTTRLSNAEDPATAWRAAFPDLDPAKPGGTGALSDALEAYRRAGRFASYEVKAPFDARFSFAPLAPAEVHMLLFDARASSRSAGGADAELEEAAREDPLHPYVLWEGARSGDRRAAMRKGTAARPDDWRAWYLLSAALASELERPEKEAALRKAVALYPDGAVIRNSLAWLLHEAGRAREAIPHANAAVDLAPWSPSVVDTLAAVASATGKCREAGILQRRAIGLVRSDAERKEYEKRLAEIEARCTAPPAAR